MLALTMLYRINFEITYSNKFRDVERLQTEVTASQNELASRQAKVATLEHEVDKAREDVSFVDD